MGFFLRVLGTLDLRGPDGRELLSVLVQPRRVALLTYLAVANPRGYHRRDTLLGLFWPDQDGEHARAALRQALHGLRRSLGEEVLLTRGDEVGLDAGAFECDVWAFEAAAARGDAEAAVAAYHGALLKGFYAGDAEGFEQWADAERDRLARLYASMLETVARARAAADPGGALEWWRKLAEHDPYSARIALQLMGALEAAGDAPAAIRHAEAHADFLKAELGSDPDPDVSAAAERLRHRAARLEPAAVRLEPPRVVSPPGPVQTAPPAAAPLPREMPRAKLRSRLIVGAVAVIAILAGIKVAPRADRLPPAGVRCPAESPEGITLTVLPFRNLTGDPGQVYVAEGFSEELSSGLAGIPCLRVRGRPSAQPSGSAEANLTELGKSLHVRYVLAGSVRTASERMRITAHLLETGDGSVVWAHTYDADLTDLLGVQQAIAGEIVDRMEIALDLPTLSRLSGGGTQVSQAYDAYLRGLAAEGPRTPDGYAEARALFQEAVALDSTFARAHSAFAFALTALATDHDAAEAAARRALRLAPGLGEPHIVLAMVAAARHEWRTERAELDAALRNEPSDFGLYYSGLAYVRSGDRARAVVEARRLMARCPTSPVCHFQAATILNHAGAYLQADSAALQGARLDSLGFEMAPAWPPYWNRGLAQFMMGDYEEGAILLETAEVLFGGNTWDMQSVAGAIAAYEQNPEDARAQRGAALHLLDQALESGPRMPGSTPFFQALFSLKLGDPDRALRVLTEAIAMPDQDMQNFVASAPLDSLRQDPRFVRLLAGLGLPPSSSAVRP